MPPRHGCWREASVPCPVDVSGGLLNVLMLWHQTPLEPVTPERGRGGSSFYDLVLEAPTHHHLHPNLLEVSH